MSQYGVKVKLTVDKSAAAKKSFQNEIEQQNFKLKLKQVSIDSKTIDTLRNDITAKLEQKPIKISKIDCSAAVKTLRNDLQNVINSLSIKNGVTISGLADPSGIGSMSTDIKDAAAAAEQGAQATTRWQAQCSNITELVKQMQKVYNSLQPSGKHELADTAQLSDFENRLTNLKEKVVRLREEASKGILPSDDDVTKVSDEVRQLTKDMSATYDTSALDNFKSKVAEVTKSMSGAKAEYKRLSNGKGTNNNQIDELKDAYEAATKALEKLQEAAKNGSILPQDDIDDAIAKIKSYKQAAESVEGVQSSWKKNKQYLAQTEPLLKKISNIQQQVETDFNKWTYAKVEKDGSPYKVILNDLGELKKIQTRLSVNKILSQPDIDANKKTIDELIQKIKNMEQGLVGAGMATTNFKGALSKQISDEAKEMAKLISYAKIIQTMYRVAKQMVSETLEIDSALTQLQIVSEASDAEMTHFLTRSISLAKELGQTVTEVLGSIETFTRLGYNLSDSSTLAEYVGILSNVADVSLDEATTGMTSIIKGYNLKVDSAEHVADVLTEVGQKYAVSAAEMMEAYEKSGAALNATNTSFEKSAGLIAAANASVQNASVVGTALKTVSARIRGAKSDLEDLGEDTTDLANGFSKYADELKALTGFDIMVSGTTDTYKDIYDIFEGLSGCWDKLSDTAQSRVAEILGGTRQLQVISSIIGNWEDATGAYTAAMESAGVATQANATYMDSIEGHTQVFKATFQELSADFINSDVAKGLVDIGTGLLNILDTLGAAPVLLLTIGASLTKIVGLGKALVSTGIIGGLRAAKQWIHPSAELKEWFDAVGDASKLENLSNAAKQAGQSFQDMGGKVGAATSALSAAMMVVGLVISGIQSYKRKVEETRQAAIEAAQESAALTNELADLANEYITLSEAVQTDKSVKDDLLDTQDALIEKLGLEKHQVKELANEYDSLSEALQDETVKQLELQSGIQKSGIESAAEQAVADAEKATDANKLILKGTKISWHSAAEYEDFDKIRDLIMGQYEYDSGRIWIESVLYDNPSSTDGAARIHFEDIDVSSVENIAAALQYLQEWLTITKETVGTNNSVYGALASKYQELSNALDGYTDSVTAYNETQAEMLMLEGLKGQTLPTTAEAFEQYRLKLIASAIAGSEFVGSGEDISNAIDSILSKQSRFAAFYDVTDDSLEDTAQTAKTTAQAFSSLMSETMVDNIDDVQTKIKTLSDALQSLHDGSLEVTDVVDLLQEFPELAEYVDLTADNFGNLDVGLRKLIKDSPKELIATLKEFKETNDLTDEAASHIDDLCNALESISTESISDISTEFGLVEQSIQKAKHALSELEDDLKEDDYDVDYDARVEHMADFQETITNGEVGSRAYAAYSEYFGLQGKSLAEVQQWVTNNKKYLTEDTSGIKAFLDTVATLGTEGGSLDGIASYSDGVLEYDITQLSAFAKALDWSEEMLQDFLDKYRMYSQDYQTRGAEDSYKELMQLDLLHTPEGGGNTIANLREIAETLGISKEEAQELLDKINELNRKNDKPEIVVADDSALKEFDGWTEDTYLSVLTEESETLQTSLKSLGLSTEDLTTLWGDPTTFTGMLSPLLEELGWTEDEIDVLYHKMYDQPWVIDALVQDSATDSLKEIESRLETLGVEYLRYFNENGEILKVDQGLLDDLQAAGATTQDIVTWIEQLASRDDIDFRGELKIDDTDLNEVIEKVREATDEPETIDVAINMTVNNEEVVATVTTTAEQIQEILGEDWKILLEDESITTASEHTTILQKLLEGLTDIDPSITIDGNLNETQKTLSGIVALLNTINNTDNGETVTTPKVSVKAYATGTRRARSGLALLGDEYSPTGAPKPELVVSGGEAYLAGVNGPTVHALKDGDIVYTNSETQRILNSSEISGTIPAFSGGAGGTNVLGGNNSAYITGTGSTSGSSNSDVTSSISSLDDALKELKETFDKILNNYEHAIFLMEKNGASTADIVVKYRKMQADIHTQADHYRAMGADENNEYIQELQKKWWELQETIEGVIVDCYETAAQEQKNHVTLTENWMDKAMADSRLADTEIYGKDTVEYYRNMQQIIHKEAEYLRSQGYSDTSDEVSKLSDLWWEYEDEIASVKQKVVDYLIEMVSETSQAVDDIQNVFDTFKSVADEFAENNGNISVDSFQKIIELGPEYLSYLKDENGMLVINEENIKKVTAARVEQLALTTAYNYVERLRLAMQKGSVEDLNQLLNATTKTTDATWGLVYANLKLLGLSDEQEAAALANINAIRALGQSAQDTALSVGSSASDLQSSLSSILDYVISMLKQEINDQIDALGEMKDAYADIISLRKEALRAAKEESDYEDSIADKTKEIAKLQERINALALDDSKSAQAERIKLQEEMADLQKDLADSQTEHSITAQEDALDEMQEAYEAEKDAEIETLEKSMSSYQKLYDMAMERLESYGDRWDDLHKDLIAWNTEYGSDLNSTVTAAWEKAIEAAKKYGSLVGAIKATDTTSSGSSSSSGSGDSDNTVVGETITDSSATDEEKTHAIVRQMYLNAKTWASATKEERAKLDANSLKLGEELAQYGITAIRKGGVWYIDKVGGVKLFDKYKQYCYHTGGIVGDDPTLEQNETLALLEKGEMVLTEDQQRQLRNDLKIKEYFFNKFGVMLDLEKFRKSLVDENGAPVVMFQNPFYEEASKALTAPITTTNQSIRMGDVYIYGANSDTVEQHKQVSRQMANELLQHLHIKK